MQNLDTTTLAKLCDVTPQTIRNLTNQGIIPRARDSHGKELKGRYNLLAVRDYCRYVRSMLKVDNAGELVNSALKNRKLEAEAEMAELKLMQIKGQLYHAADIEFVMTNMLTFFKQSVLAIPTRVARLLVGKKTFSEIFDILTTEIVQSLRELTGYDPATFAQATAVRLAKQGIDMGTNGKEATKKKTSTLNDSSEE